MTWNEILMQALKDPEELKKMSELARRHWEPGIVPKFDYKMIESEGREPGEDE